MKRIYSLLCAAAVGLSGMTVFPANLPVFAEEEKTTSGTCGENLTWEFDAETGTLTISGEGEMENYHMHVGPLADWGTYNNQIKKIVLPDALTKIGDCAFTYCENLTDIVIPESVTEIGWGGFL